MLTLLLLLIPWGEINGNSLLRVDIPGLTLFFFGQTLRIEELYLVLICSLLLTVGFLLVTMLLGRVWCGWLCPQTTLTDIAEWFCRRMGIKPGKKSGSLFRHAALHVFYLFLAFLVSSNLLWYFIEPQQYFSRLVHGQLHYATWICLLLVAIVVYLDLALIRRLMCSDFCPYGRFQASLADDTTLALHLPPSELERCIKCGSCVRVCPMEIDIREGYQVECINCGRCLDACRKVMVRQEQPGLISYSFGTSGKGAGALLNPRTLLLTLLSLALVIILVLAIYHRPAASLKIAVSHSAPERMLKDGSRATFFNAWLNNRSSKTVIFRLEAHQKENGENLVIKGQSKGLELEAGENLRIDFVLVTPATKDRLDVEFILIDEGGIVVATSNAYIK